MGRRKRPRGRVRRAGKRARTDSAHDIYVVGCVLEELTREVEALDELLPQRRCARCDEVLPPCVCGAGTTIVRFMKIGPLQHWQRIDAVLARGRRR